MLGGSITQKPLMFNRKPQASTFPTHKPPHPKRVYVYTGYMLGLNVCVYIYICVHGVYEGMEKKMETTIVFRFQVSGLRV